MRTHSKGTHAQATSEKKETVESPSSGEHAIVKIAGNCGKMERSNRAYTMGEIMPTLTLYLRSWLGKAGLGHMEAELLKLHQKNIL
jgi:hypothetical protein